MAIKKNVRKSADFEIVENGYIIILREEWEDEKGQYFSKTKKYVETKATKVKERIKELIKTD